MIRFEVSVDDGCELDRRLAHLCEQYKIPCTFYLPVDYLSLAWNKGYEPLKPQTLGYIASHHEIGSHGVTHAYLTKIPAWQAEEEIRDSKKMLENMLERKVNKFCYPRGYANDMIKQCVKEAGYTYARSTVIGSLEAPEDPFFAETTVHIGCPVRPEYAGTTWLDYAKEMLDKAKAEPNKDHIYHAWYHSWEIEKYNEWGNVEKFFAMIGTAK